MNNAYGRAARTALTLFPGLLSMLVTSQAAAQSPIRPELIVDPNTAAEGLSSAPSLFDRTSSGNPPPTIGTYSYFNATTALGRELWRFQESPGSAELVADIRTGPDSSEPRNHTPVGNRLFFTADDGIHGRELWVTDGTPNGTSLFADLIQGSGEPQYRSFAAFQGELYFACDIGNGFDLYATDSATTSVRLVADIRPNNDDAAVDQLIPSPDGSALVFTADNGLSGNELWVTNGTSATTRELADLSPGPDSSYPVLFPTGVFGDWIYFGALAPADETVFCRTDGQTNEILRTFGATSFQRQPLPLFPFQGEMWFRAEDPLTGREIYRSDGTPNGTTLWADLTPGTGNTVVWGAGKAADDSAIYLNTNFDLRIFDGVNTVLVPNLNPSRFSSVGNTVVCAIRNDPNVGEEPYRIFPDGTYQLLIDVGPGESGSFPRQFWALGNSILFLANSPSIGAEIFFTDGTPQGTGVHTDIDPRTRTAPFNAFDFISVGNRAFLGGRDAIAGRELWVTDGTAAGTRLVDDIRVGPLSSEPLEITAIGQDVVFSARDDANGRELWFSDGTPGGTRLVKNIRNGSEDSNPTNFAELDGIVYFTADDGVRGFELWRTDGTPAGTFLLADIDQGPGSSFPSKLVVSGRSVYFRANDGSTGIELWRTDGTPGGTVRISDINTDPVRSGSSSIQNLIPTPEGVAFIAFDGDHSTPWISDGQTVTQIATYADLGDRDAEEIALTDGGRFYVATDSSALTFRSLIGDVYRIDHGQVTQLTSFTEPNDLNQLRTFGEGALFRLDFRSTYKTDGTPQGTALLADLSFRIDDSYLVGETLYFDGRDPDGTSNLWQTDGTATGTRLVPGIQVDNSGSFFLLKGDLLFFADLPTQQGVLHALRQPGANVLPFGRGCGAPERGLRASRPVLGQNVTVETRGPTGTNFTAVFLDPIPGTRLKLLGCEFYLGALSQLALSGVGANRTGTIPVPNDMSLIDKNFALQAAWFGSTGAFVVSRGLLLSIDDK